MFFCVDRGIIGRHSVLLGQFKSIYTVGDCTFGESPARVCSIISTVQGLTGPLSVALGVLQLVLIVLCPGLRGYMTGTYRRIGVFLMPIFRMDGLDLFGMVNLVNVYAFNFLRWEDWLGFPILHYE